MNRSDSMGRRKWVWLLVGAVAVAAALAGVLLRGGGPRPGPPRAEKIRIGVILPLTGELSYFGEGDRKALQLYAEQNPDTEFLFEDSRGTARDGLSAANKLSAEGVRYYITSLSFIVNTVQPLFDDQKSLNFTLNMDPRSEERSHYCLRLYVTFYDEMDKLVELARSRNAKRVAVLYVNVETMNHAVENYLRSRLESFGIELVTETYDIGAKDFRQPLLKLSTSNPDLVRVMDFGDKLGVILNQMAEGGLFPKATIVSGIETLLADYRHFPAALTPRYAFTAPRLLFDESNPVVRAYRARYNEAPNYDAMFAYDIANLIVPSIRKHGYNDPDAVIREITALGRHEGVTAVYRVNQHGGFSPEVFWATVRDGAIELDGQEQGH